MWIQVYRIWNMNFNSKIGRKRSFSYESKAWLSFIPMRGMCLWCLIMKWMAIICESMFVQNDRWTLILKMVGKKFFLWNQSINIIYPCEENVLMVPSHERERRLLSESISIPIERRTSILKLVERKVCPMKPKHQYHLS